MRAWWTNPSVRPDASPWECIKISIPAPRAFDAERYAGFLPSDHSKRSYQRGSVLAHPMPMGRLLPRALLVASLLALGLVARCRPGAGRNEGDRDRRLALPGRDRLAERLRIRDPVRLRPGEPRQRCGLHGQARPVRARPVLRDQPARGRVGGDPRRRLPPRLRERRHGHRRPGRCARRGEHLHRGGRLAAAGRADPGPRRRVSVHRDDLDEPADLDQGLRQARHQAARAEADDLHERLELVGDRQHRRVRQGEVPALGRRVGRLPADRAGEQLGAAAATGSGSTRARAASLGSRAGSTWTASASGSARSPFTDALAFHRSLHVGDESATESTTPFTPPPSSWPPPACRGRRRRPARRAWPRRTCASPSPPTRRRSPSPGASNPCDGRIPLPAPS